MIKEMFDNLKTWKRKGQRAPHKPLLALYALGRLLREEKRMISYEEISVDLDKLLRDFGPSRAAYHPEFPFWRLQKDGMWEVENAETIDVSKSGDAKKSELIRNNIKGGFKKSVFQELHKNDELFKNIVQGLLDSHFPASIHEDILQTVGIDITVTDGKRKRSPEFRQKILRAYEYKCAICGFDVRLGHNPIALEAAHIKWHNAGGPDTEVNGLSLCVLHHKLFDRGAFTLSDDLIILVSDHANGTQGFQESLMKFHGQKLQFPQRKNYLPHQDFRQWHVREVFQGEFRDL
ncbi:HNH endonuclease [Desulfobacterales bacterium HSG16]|nr:HNH endonuclease [Desulfobacterales bacterium HSG16]